MSTGPIGSAAIGSTGPVSTVTVESVGFVSTVAVGTGPAGLCLAAQLAQFPSIETMIVERMPSNIIKGKADGINTRTMEMFQAFGFADKVKRETYWVNQTAFWMPDPARPDHIQRVGRVQDVMARFRSAIATANNPACRL